MAATCKLRVHAGEHDRTTCPVSVELPWSYADCHAVALCDAETKKPVPCQVTRAKGNAVLTWLVNGLKAGHTQTLVARLVEAPSDRARVLVVDDKTNCKVDVLIGGRLFTSYQYGAQWVRPFLHPVIGPYGTQVTRNWPIVQGAKGDHKDHIHHKSIWVAYGECGNVDNWSEEKGHGWQRHRRFLRKASGPVYGEIVGKNDWCTNAGKKQFEEIRDMRFYALPGEERLFDITVTFRMTEGPVIFHDTKEGGLVSIRVASSMDVRNGGRINNGYGGINEAETWGKHAPWCDYSGPVDGRHVGIAVMDHETNPRYPTQWHVRDYGLMTANCFAWKHYQPEAKRKGDMAFSKGRKTTWRYRLHIHKGDAEKGKVKSRFLDFIAPPEITVG